MNRSPVAITASPGFPSPVRAPEREMTIGDFFTVVRRRQAIVWGIVLAVMTLGIAKCATSTRLYRASAVLQIQSESADALSLDNMIVQSNPTQDAVESNISLQTEAKILESDSLALNVIQALHLEKSPDFQSHFSLIGWVIGHLTPSDKRSAGDASIASAGAQTRIIRAFESHLKVKPISGTRLISIEYLSSDPHTAEAVINLLVQNLMDFNFETRHGATQQAAAWLSNQLADLRKESDQLEARVEELQRGSDVFTLGQTDSQGHDQVYTPALERLQMATTELSQAQSARIMKGALYQVVKDGNPELISGLAGSTLSGSSPGISGSLSLVQDLRAQEAQKQAQLNELAAKFGPRYPKIAELQASLQSTQKAIHDEAQRIADRVRNDYAVALQVEQNDRSVFQQDKQQAEVLNNKATEYEIARQEATQSRSLYNSLLARMKEADLVAGLRPSNITVVDPARLPSRPAKPNVPLYVAGSLAAGLFLGICAALLRDATDYSIQNIDTMSLLGRDLPIGILPYHAERPARRRLQETRKTSFAFSLETAEETVTWTRSADSMVAAAEPRAPFTEALRTLRTSLIQSGQGGEPPQVILITSSTPGEGKSMLSINLATVYAQHGKKVLLVDADLRTPVLQRRLNLPPCAGLTDLLSRGDDSPYSLSPVRIALEGGNFLDVIPAGPSPLYPAELLASSTMATALGRWRREYDSIIIDGAPLLPVTDSAILSVYSDVTLVVARHKVTDRRSLDMTLRILESQGIRNQAVVLNAVRVSGGEQYTYYGYKPISYPRGGHAA